MYRIILTLMLTGGLLWPSLLWAGNDAPKLTRDEQKALYEAQEAIKKDDFRAARQVLLAHLKAHPDSSNSLVYYALGNAWYLDGKLKPAYDAYEKGFGLDPESRNLCLNLGKVAYELERYAKAGKLFETAARMSGPGEKADLLYQAGAAYYQGKALQKARGVLNRLVRGRKRVDKSWLQLLIQVCLDLKRWKEAEGLVQRFLREERDNLAYWRLLAQIRMRQADYRGAAAALEIVYGIDRPTVKDLEELANLYFYMNVPLRALRTLERAYGSSPKPARCEKLARAAAQAQHADQAIRYLDQAIRQTPAPGYFLQKGQIWYDRGRWDEAIACFQQCVRKDPQQARGQLLLGYCLMEKERFAEARTAFSGASKDRKYRKQARAALKVLAEMTSDNAGE